MQAIAWDLGVSTDGLPEIALRFCLSHPAVTTVIPGMRSLESVNANVKAAQLGPLDEHQLARSLARHRWQRVRDFYPRG